MRFILPPKPLADTRTYTVDFSPFVPVGFTLASATGTNVVFSGIDPTAGAMIANVAVDASGTQVTFQMSAGVDGVIYLISIHGVFSSGSPYTGTTITQNAYLAVVENQ